MLGAWLCATTLLMQIYRIARGKNCMLLDGCRWLLHMPGTPLAGTSPSPGVSPSVTLPTIPGLTPPTSGGGNTTLPANATGGPLVIRAFWATTPKEGVCYKFNGTGFEADNSTTYGGCLWGRLADTAAAAWGCIASLVCYGPGRQRPVKLLPASASIAGVSDVAGMCHGSASVVPLASFAPG